MLYKKKKSLIKVNIDLLTRRVDNNKIEITFKKNYTAVFIDEFRAL